LFAFGGFGLFLIFVVAAGHAVLRRARWGLSTVTSLYGVVLFLSRSLQKGVQHIAASAGEYFHLWGVFHCVTSF